MADKTGISWCDATWNPIRGCSRVSEGCRHCYAERVAARFCGPGQPYEGLIKLVARHPRQLVDGGDKSILRVATESRWNGAVHMVPEHLADPLRWKKPRRIFVNSMSDLFHEALTNEQIAAVFGVMAAAPQHTFQVLTKRAKRMREWFEWLTGEPIDVRERLDRAACEWLNAADEKLLLRVRDVTDNRWPLPNVWLGVSVENQAAADERIPELLATPAAVRFLSCEPLIGPVDLVRWVFDRRAAMRRMMNGPAALNAEQADAYIAEVEIDWVIVGCESGPGARPCDVAWLRSLRDQCGAAGVPFFLKQAQYTAEVGRPLERTLLAVHEGQGSKRKAGGVIELPYLDGVQHAAFPEVTRG